jgi:hypothetical protein
VKTQWPMCQFAVIIIMDEFFFRKRFLYLLCDICPWVRAFVSVTSVTHSLQLNVDGICHEWKNDVTLILYSNMYYVFVQKCLP